MPSLMAILGLNTGPFKSAASDAQHIASHLGNHIKNSIGTLAAGFVSEEAIHRTIEWGESVFDTAIKLQMTKEEVQRLDYALKQSGTSLLQHTKFFELLGIARDKASRGAAKPEQMQAFQNFGITASDISNKSVSLVSIMAQAVERGMDNDRLLASLKALGGRGGTDMAEAFRLGLGDLMKAAPVVSDRTIDQLKEAGDQMKSVFAEIRAALAPAVAWIATTVTGTFHALAKAINFVTGAFGEMLRQSSEVISHPFKFMEEARKTGKLPEGFGIGEALKAGKEQAKEYSEGVESAEKSRRDAMARASRLHGGLGEDSPEIQQTKKLLDLRQKLFDAQAANDLKTLSREGQIVELQRRRAEIYKAGLKSKTEEGQINAATDIEKIDAELRGLRVVGGVETDKAAKHHSVSQDLNSLQRIGGMFVSSPLEMTALEVARRSEHHLQAIKEHFHGNKTGWNSRHH